MDQFIDMCILLGCDYCDPIRGIGPKKALDLVIEHKTIENILESLKGSKYEIPDDWPYKDARELFRNPDVNPWLRVGMSPLETELRARMKRNKVATEDAAKAENASEVKVETTDEHTNDQSSPANSTDAPEIAQTTDGTADAQDSSMKKEELDATSQEDNKATEEEQDAQAKATQESSAPEETAEVDPYTTAVIPKDLSSSQSPEIPRKKVQIKDLVIEWTEPDIDGLVAFLCTDKGFSEERVRTGASKLMKATKQKQQGRLDGFFKPQPKSQDELGKAKRKLEEKKNAEKAAKKQKTKGGKGGKPK